MLSKGFSAAVIGVHATVIEVEVDVSPGLPNFTVVGLPDAAVQEARDRVRAAVKNYGKSIKLRLLNTSDTMYISLLNHA